MTPRPTTPADWKRAAHLVKTMSEPLRLDAFLMIAEGERRPGEIHAAHGLPFPAVTGTTSNRLTRLRLLGLVEARGHPGERTYVITPAGRVLAERLARFVATMGQGP